MISRVSPNLVPVLFLRQPERQIARAARRDDASSFRAVFSCLRNTGLPRGISHNPFIRRLGRGGAGHQNRVIQIRVHLQPNDDRS